MKTVEIYDKWQQIQIIFTVFYPNVHPNQILKIHGNRLELSTNEKFSLNSIQNGIEMKKSNRDINWII